MALISMRMKPVNVFITRCYNANSLHDSSLFNSKFTAAYLFSKYKLGRNMSSQSSFIDIDINKLKEFQKNPSATIIDVREVNEINETGILPGATNIPLGEVSTALRENEETFKNLYKIEKPLLENPLVFSCRSGRRSAMASQTAASLGYESVYNYAGGWLDWEKNHSSK